MQYLYFFADCRSVSPEKLAECGLATILGPCRQGAIDDGPGGGAGVLVGSSAEPAPPLHAGGLKWHKPGERRAYWLGVNENDPPTAGQLQRPRPIDGRMVHLPTGQAGLAGGSTGLTTSDWLVPVARFAAGGTGLPVAYGLDAETGETTAAVAESFAALWEMGGEVVDDMIAMATWVQAKETDPNAPRPDGVIDTAREKEIAAAAVGTNYRVGLDELLAVGALDQQTVGDILAVLIDVAGWRELTAQAAADAAPDAPAGEPGGDDSKKDEAGPACRTGRSPAGDG